MKLAWPLEILGTGASVPEQVLTNDDLTKRVDTTDEWIVQRTGIRERRIAAEGESTLTFATAAARQALAEAGLGPDGVDLIIVSTISPEHPLPATACELQAALGCPQIPAFDMQAACSGFVWGLIQAGQFIQSGMARRVLLLGAETLSRITDWEDRGTCILFGDGAGAAVVGRSDDSQRGVLAAQMGCDGVKGKHIWIPAGGSAEPASLKTVNERLHTMKMAGREVYKFAVTKMHEIVKTTAEEAGVSLDEIKLIVPHQSNARIIESACSKLDFPLERVVMNIDRYGNTSAASVVLGLHEARQAGRLEPGDLVMLAAFGAGLTWGSCLLRV